MNTYKISIGPMLPGKIPPGSPYWKEFNGSFQNKEATQSSIASDLYLGKPITTWHSNNWRNRDNYIVGQHLGVDFDTEDARSEMKTLLDDPFINKYASILYTTPSHTIDAPRARVVFLLEQPIHQADNYANAAAALLWLFSAADTKCKDPCRFFYGAGEGADMELLNGRLPLAIIKDMITRYQRTGQTHKKTVQNYTPQNTEEKDVQEALKYINPWGIEYDQWVSVLMAIHSEFPGGNGLAMADAWGQGSTGEVQRKWKSFDTGGNSGGRVGMGTLFQIAMDNGYRKN